MSTQQEIFTNLAALPDAEFFALPSPRSDAAEAQLARSGFEGMVVNAPAVVDIAVRQSLPLMMLRRMSVLRNWEARPHLNTQLMAVDLDRGDVYVRNAYQESKRRWPAVVEKSMSGERPGEDAAEDAFAKVDVFDARQLLQLPWRPAHLLVRMVYLDWVSNAVKVELQQAGNGLVVAPYPADEAGALRGRPEYDKKPDSPPLSGPGAALRLPEQAAAGAPIPVSGAVRMAASPHAVAEGGGAVLSGELILASRDERDPLKIPVKFPSVAQGAVEPGRLVDGYFQFDLRRRAEVKPGTYFVYFAAGEYLSAPQKLTINP